jgi:hypothetical protein
VKLTLKKKIGAAVASVALVGAGTMAFAYWTSTGSGTGTASAGSASAVTIVQTSTVSDLGPGTAAQALSGTFTTDRPVYVGQVSVDDTTTDQAGCDADDFQAVDPDATNAEVETGDTWGGGSIVFVNKPAVDQDACQGATVTVHYVSN